MGSAASKAVEAFQVREFFVRMCLVLVAPGLEPRTELNSAARALVLRASFQEYTDSVVPGLVSVRAIIARLATIANLKKLPLNAEDSNECTSIDAAARDYIAQLQEFTCQISAQMEVIESRLLSTGEFFPTLESCYRGYSEARTLQKIRELQANGDALQARINVFSRAPEEDVQC